MYSRIVITFLIYKTSEDLWMRERKRETSVWLWKVKAEKKKFGRWQRIVVHQETFPRGERDRETSIDRTTTFPRRMQSFLPSCFSLFRPSTRHRGRARANKRRYTHDTRALSLLPGNRKSHELQKLWYFNLSRNSAMGNFFHLHRALDKTFQL